MKLKLISLTVLSAFLLQACGGSDGDSGSNVNQSNSGGNQSGTKPNPTSREQTTGKVEQIFTANANAKFVVIAHNAFSTGAVTVSATPQSNDGSFKTLGSYSLTGAKVAVQDIAGNANFAVGRWSWGTLNVKSGSNPVQSSELQATRNGFVNYAVFNQFESAALGKKNCVASAFTQPYLVRSVESNDAVLATTTGTASFELISQSDAKFEISLKTDNGKYSRTSSFYPGKKADYNTGGSTIISGGSSVNPATSFVSNGEYQVSIGQGLAGEIILIANYRNQLGDNAPVYAGLAVFTCK